MRRMLLFFVPLAGMLLVLPGLCAAPALAASAGRSDTLVLHNLGHGKAALMRFTYDRAALVPTTEWSGALPAGAKLACGSFDGVAADEALVLAPLGRHGARLLLLSPATVGYGATTLWSTAKAGFSATAAKIVAADLTGSGSDELVVLGALRRPRRPPFGPCLERHEAHSHHPVEHEARALQRGLRPACRRRSHRLGQERPARLLVRSRPSLPSGVSVPRGTKLALHWHWASSLPAATKLACGVASGASHFAAWLLSPTSAGRARLTTLTATDRGFSAHRAWSGALRLPHPDKRRRLARSRPRRSRRAHPQGQDGGHAHNADAAGHGLLPPDRLERKEWLSLPPAWPARPRYRARSPPRPRCSPAPRPPTSPPSRPTRAA